jgi:hypothetical protein
VPLSRPSSVAFEPGRESRSRAQAQLDDLGVDGVIHVLGGCARAHPPDVASELVSWRLAVTTRPGKYRTIA